MRPAGQVGVDLKRGLNWPAGQKKKRFADPCNVQANDWSN